MTVCDLDWAADDRSFAMFNDRFEWKKQPSKHFRTDTSCTAPLSR